MEGVEAAQLGRHVVAPLVGLGNHHHQRVRQRTAGEHEQLEHVVEGRGVGAAGADHRQHLLEVVAEELGRKLRLARAHPVAVAAERVDLAVVRDHAVRVGELPAREGVRRVAGVHEGEGARDPFVREVEIEALELRGRQHSLVDKCPRGEARHDEIGAGCELGDAADDVELPLERLFVEVVRGSDDGLADAGRDLGGDGPGLGEGDRDVAPAEEPLPFVADRPLDERFELCPARLVEGEEERTDAVPAGGGQALDRRSEERIGQLDQDSGAVAGICIGPRGAAMLEVRERSQGPADRFVGGLPIQPRDERHPAGIVLVGRVVEA